MTRTQKILRLLRDFESPNVLAIAPDLSAPIVWEKARGVHVWDAADKKYLDLTAAFGVAAAGHANPRVVAAGSRQMGTLLHAMGDVYPHARKAELARELSRLTFERWTAAKSPEASSKAVAKENCGKPATSVSLAPPAGRGLGRGAQTLDSGTTSANPSEPTLTGKTIFANSGFEAVEAALKTAILATNRPRILSFTGAYHGLGYGALNATHREHFRGPFRRQLGGFSSIVPFPKSAEELDRLENTILKLARTQPFGAILVEPIQARGGINVPPRGFLPLLRRLCNETGALLILDEIYTGFGRTGRWFACERDTVIPELICLGKALTGGFPLAACVGRADLMDAAWPRSTGEAIHTSTFLGHPVGCAMALAQIKEIADKNLPQHSAAHGEFLLEALRAAIPSSPYRIEVRGVGLMAGVEFLTPDAKPATAAALRVLDEMLRAGFILLPEGEFANILSFTPPLTITRSQLASTARAFARAIAALPAP
jgi:4-aminobutyrate aminotransferase-like enzyme